VRWKPSTSAQRERTKTELACYPHGEAWMVNCNQAASSHPRVSPLQHQRAFESWKGSTPLNLQSNPGGTAEFAKASFVPEWMKDFLFNRKGGLCEQSNPCHVLEAGTFASTPPCLQTKSCRIK
jgi:hypothetical protein